MSSSAFVRTFAAMSFGVGTVSFGTLAAAKLDPSPAPSFAASYSGASRYDQSTFAGRYKKMFFACNPLMLLKTEAELRAAEKELKEFRAKWESDKSVADKLSPDENARLWDVKTLVDSAVHPDTGEIIPHPFRMSGYVPFNGPICVAMVVSSSTFGLLFWAWMNQSQNALVNFYNRNATSPMTNETLMRSYGTAVTTALSVGFVLSTAIKKKCDPARAAQLLKFVAFPSSVLASSLNCYIVQSPGIESGVPLLDPSTQSDVLPGSCSSAAARKGVLETTASRAILQAPVYFLPPLMTATIFAGVVAANPAVSVPLTTYLLLVSFGFGLPFAIAVFPQYGEIDVSEVEDKFKNIKDKDGKVMTKFSYNKGL